ncbi:MAG: hypothetical protein IKA72_04150 [Clostridia bacterium]|nr:hypothetical protein [Clostridia bacterium]
MNNLKLALIGKDVSKSQSGIIHKFILQKFGCDCDFEYLSVSNENFFDETTRLLDSFDGFSVTIPYKQEIINRLDEICGDAVDFNAVNTVVCASKKGYNTDGVGLLLMLKTAGVCLKGKKALILGAGGAGSSAALVFKKQGADVYLYRRNQQELEKTCAFLGVNKATEFEKGGYDIVLNATGVGMHESVGVSPVGAGTFRGAKLAIDLIYYPFESEFLRLARGAGLRVLNGAPMLFYQAYFADCIYLGKEPSELEAKEFYADYLNAQS